MSKHLIKITDKNIEILVQYDDESRLISFSIFGTITDVFYKWLIQKLPISQNGLKVFKPIKGVTVEKIEEDTSFERFWDDYDNKISNKKRTEKLWDTLDELEKIKAIHFIKKYKRHLFENQGQSQKHADTYLRQAIWNN